jgi:hypothetical protein
MSDTPDKPRIIIDSDWKEQAEREKEQLAAKAEKAKPAAREMPQPDFLQHCASLATQALVFLGAIIHPLSGKPEFDPEQARYLIDTLDMLRTKTKGNLDQEEATALDEMLQELKMAWVQLTQKAPGAGK